MEIAPAEGAQPFKAIYGLPSQYLQVPPVRTDMLSRNEWLIPTGLVFLQMFASDSFRSAYFAILPSSIAWRTIAQATEIADQVMRRMA